MQVGEGIIFPPLLKQFEKKEYLITVQVSEENIKKSSNVYLVKKICHVAETTGNHNPEGPHSPLIPQISMNVVRI